MKSKIESWLPGLADNIKRLADGVYMIRTVKNADGEEAEHVYRIPPLLAANVYLIDRAMGKPATEQNETDVRLNLARAMFIEQQIASGFIEAQVKDLAARGARAEIEVEMWPKQFVTEEEQERQLRDLARHANAGLLSLTPEMFAELAPGVKDPAEALERLKGRVSVTQAQVFEAVMSGGKEVADEEDESDEEAEE